MSKILIVIILLLSLAAIAVIESKQGKINIPIPLEVGKNTANMIYLVYDNECIFML